VNSRALRARARGDPRAPPSPLPPSPSLHWDWERGGRGGEETHINRTAVRLQTQCDMLPFVHPFTAIVAGPTSCGKTRFVFRLIDNAAVMMHPPPSKIVYCYGEHQSLFDEYPRVVFHRGLPDIGDFDGSEPVLLIIDDLMQETNESVANLFTKGSHHRNVSVVFLAQNLFPKNKFARTMSLNAHYMVLFKNPRDASQFANLARQMYPKMSRFAVEAYKDATCEPYSYLLVDLRPEQDEALRLRTNVFPGETHYVYVPK